MAAGGYELFIWLVNISSTAFFVNWLIISFTSYRFHATLRAQNDPLFTQPYAWTSLRWPLMPAWLFLISLLLTACCITAAVEPLGGVKLTPYYFFQYVIGLVIIVGCTGLYKLVMRTPWRDPKTADLVTGRRVLTAEEIGALDAYYRLPAWRRFLGYVQLW